MTGENLNRINEELANATWISSLRKEPVNDVAPLSELTGEVTRIITDYIRDLRTVGKETNLSDVVASRVNPLYELLARRNGFGVSVREPSEATKTKLRADVDNFLAGINTVLTNGHSNVNDMSLSDEPRDRRNASELVLPSIKVAIKEGIDDLDKQFREAGDNMKVN